MQLWEDLKTWMFAPFQRPQDPLNWALLVILSATLAYLWSKVLDNVLEQ